MEYARWQDAYEISYGAIDKANCARLRLTALAFDLAFDLAFESNSHVALPIVRGGKWIRSEAV
jgi:hypothetical protein